MKTVVKNQEHYEFSSFLSGLRTFFFLCVCVCVSWFLLWFWGVVHGVSLFFFVFTVVANS